jgi:hypothetical protein
MRVISNQGTQRATGACDPNLPKLDVRVKYTSFHFQIINLFIPTCLPLCLACSLLAPLHTTGVAILHCITQQQVSDGPTSPWPLPITCAVFVTRHPTPIPTVTVKKRKEAEGAEEELGALKEGRERSRVVDYQLWYPWFGKLLLGCRRMRIGRSQPQICQIPRPQTTRLKPLYEAEPPHRCMIAHPRNGCGYLIPFPLQMRVEGKRRIGMQVSAAAAVAAGCCHQCHWYDDSETLGAVGERDRNAGVSKTVFGCQTG